jgi:hypothetical protein
MLGGKRERPFRTQHRELLPGFLGAAISLDPICRHHARASFRGVTRCDYIKPGVATLPGLRRGIAQAFGRADPCPFLALISRVSSHTDPITLLDDGDVDPNRGLGTAPQGGLATGNRSARSDSGCAAKGTGLGR